MNTGNSILDSFTLSDRVALVTGGGSGLGFEIANVFITLGAQVMIVGQNAEKLETAARALGPKCRFMAADINDEAAMATVVAEVESDFGRLDILVNNAGNHMKKSVDEMSVDDVRKVLDTHVIAAFATTKACLPLLRRAEAPSVLFLASMASYLSIPKIIGYTAAKSAVLGLVRGLAAELSPEGIRVNGIAPGWITSPMTDKALSGDPERKAKILGRTPMGKMGEPADIGMAAAYLSSPAAKFVNGHVLVVDGGAVSGF